MENKNFIQTEKNLINSLNSYDASGFISNLHILKNKFNQNYELNQLKSFFSGNLTNIQKTKKMIYFLKKCGLKTKKQTNFVKKNNSCIINVRIPEYYYKSQRFIGDKLPSYLKNNAFFRGCGTFETIIVQKPSRNEKILRNSTGFVKKTFTYIDF